MSYYDLDDILADAEKVPCRFNILVPGLGYLEGQPGKAIQKDTKIELPLWLAEILAICELLEESQQSFIDLLQPEFISPKVINAIKTNPTSVDLHAILPYYYRLTEKWASMFSDSELATVVSETLKQRSLEIYNHANSATKQLNFIYSLDEYEKEVFKKTSESSRSMRQWLKY
jgi:GINS complex subunit 3